MSYVSERALLLLRIFVDKRLVLRAISVLLPCFYTWKTVDFLVSHVASSSSTCLLSVWESAFEKWGLLSCQLGLWRYLLLSVMFKVLWHDVRNFGKLMAVVNWIWAWGVTNLEGNKLLRWGKAFLSCIAYNSNPLKWDIDLSKILRVHLVLSFQLVIVIDSLM